MALRGVFPGSFDPLTVAHLAMADAARAAMGLDELVLMLSALPLAKDHQRQTPVDERVAAIDRATADRPWLRAEVSVHQLVADLATGFDVVVMGADKWHQLHDVAFYESEQHRAEALERLPNAVVFHRHGEPEITPTARLTILELPDDLAKVSSTAVRAGADHWRA